MNCETTIDKFGMLDFQQIEEIFDARLFGLSEMDTEDTLESLRFEWGSYSESNRREILKEYLNEEHC